MFSGVECLIYGRQGGKGVWQARTGKGKVSLRARRRCRYWSWWLDVVAAIGSRTYIGTSQTLEAFLFGILHCVFFCRVQGRYDFVHFSARVSPFQKCIAA